MARIATGRQPHGVAIAPDGGAVYVSNEMNSTLAVINPQRNEVTATLPVSDRPNQIEVSADGRRLTPDDRIAVISNTASNDVTLVDARTRRTLATLPLGSGPKRLAVGVARVDAAAQGGTP